MSCGARLPASEATSTAKVIALRDGRPYGRDGCMSRPSCKAFILRLFFLLHDLCISVSIWVEIRGITRKLFEMQAFGSSSLEKVFDLVSPMDRRPVPDHHYLARDLAHQHA